MVGQHNSSAKSDSNTYQPTVFVVDDDTSMREALARLFYSVQLRVEVFASAQEFLQSKRPDVPGCLVLDIRLPGLSGLDFQTGLMTRMFEFQSCLLRDMAIFRCPCAP